MTDADWWLARRIDVGEPALLSSGMRILAEALMSAEADELCGASFGRRSPDRKDHRNGHRTVTWDSGLHRVKLRAPKLRKNAYEPAWLESGLMGGRLVAATAAAALVNAPDAADIRSLVDSLGIGVTSDEHLAVVASALRTYAEEFHRREAGPEPVFPAISIARSAARDSDRILVAAGVDEEGERRVLGITAAEDQRSFFEGLKASGLAGVETISAPPGDVLTEAQRAWPEALVRLVPDAPEPLLKSAPISAVEQPVSAVDQPAPAGAPVHEIRPVAAPAKAKLAVPKIAVPKLELSARARILRPLALVGIGAALAMLLVMLRLPFGMAALYAGSLLVALIAFGVAARWATKPRTGALAATAALAERQRPPESVPQAGPAAPSAGTASLVDLGVTWAEETPVSEGWVARISGRLPRKALIGGVAGVWVLLLAGGAKILLTPNDFSGPGGSSTVVKITAGSSLTEIGETLRRGGVVASVDAFVDAADGPKGKVLHPGSYRLRKELPAADAMGLLLDPKNKIQSKVTVPEGLRLDETLALLSRKTKIPLADFRSVAAHPETLRLPPYAAGTLEGFLFPATYDIEPGATAHSLLDAMVIKFRQVAAELGLNRTARPRDAVVLASLAQAEGGRDSDYPKIARVLDNRLRLHKRLELDTTVLYAQGRRTLHVTENDTKVASPYNTYQVGGLPAGPISNPGLPALRAALKPAHGDWLWFVATDPKHRITRFTDSEDEFLSFRDELNRNLRGDD